MEGNRTAKPFAFPFPSFGYSPPVTGQKSNVVREQGRTSRRPFKRADRRTEHHREEPKFSSGRRPLGSRGTTDRREEDVPGTATATATATVAGTKVQIESPMDRSRAADGEGGPAAGFSRWVADAGAGVGVGRELVTFRSGGGEIRSAVLPLSFV